MFVSDSGHSFYRKVWKVTEPEQVPVPRALVGSRGTCLSVKYVRVPHDHPSAWHSLVLCLS